MAIKAKVKIMVFSYSTKVCRSLILCQPLRIEIAPALSSGMRIKCFTTVLTNSKH